MKIRLVILMALLAFGSLPARVINVPAEYATIQAGIDASVTGDTVLVAPGEYAENPQIADKNILLTSSSDPLECYIHGTLSIGADVDSTCQVRGFEITGTGFNSSIEIDTSSPIIEANIIQNNPFMGSGAVIVSNSNAILRNNIIKRNSGGGGIGIAASGFPIIENNLIAENFFSIGDGIIWGGGMYIRGGIVRRNVIIDNSIYCYYGGCCGGGIFKAAGSRFFMYNNTVLNNHATGHYSGNSGGGILIDTAPTDNDIVIKNNIFAYNNDDGIYVTNSDSIIWDYNLVYSNNPTNYRGIQPGSHDIQADPMFVDPSIDDYHLLPNSPCIDAGDPSFPLDPDSTRCDIGAYFFDQGVGIDDGTPSGPYQFTLQQNYPNPFNAETIISYSLPNEAAVTLRVMAITGQLVKTISDGEHQGPGEHRVVWDGTDKHGQTVSTGIYFYELYVDTYRESKAMIMVR